MASKFTASSVKIRIYGMVDGPHTDNQLIKQDIFYVLSDTSC